MRPGPHVLCRVFIWMDGTQLLEIYCDRGDSDTPVSLPRPLRKSFNICKANRTRSNSDIRCAGGLSVPTVTAFVPRFSTGETTSFCPHAVPLRFAQRIRVSLLRILVVATVAWILLLIAILAMLRSFAPIIALRLIGLGARSPVGKSPPIAAGNLSFVRALLSTCLLICFFPSDSIFDELIQ
ncbi:hypothetical protein BD309DRAFT_958871 [Dichomitus squalens]|nr:hypothetical protein BD309DRAFT_958871 [Dichomitus squalens]